VDPRDSRRVPFGAPSMLFVQEVQVLYGP
jgi:hypothetical protein